MLKRAHVVLFSNVLLSSLQSCVEFNFLLVWVQYVDSLRKTLYFNVLAHIYERLCIVTLHSSA